MQHHYTGSIKVMTVSEVAVYLRIARVTVYKMARTGKIPAFRIGSDWPFNVEAIDRWCLEQQNPDSEQGQPNTRRV